MTIRDDLLHAIDRLADAAAARDGRRVEARRRDARALTVLLVPACADAPQALRCPHCRGGVTFKTQRRLDEHVHYVHDGPEPDHWHEEDEGTP
jgi:hypothetical protein